MNRDNDENSAQRNEERNPANYSNAATLPQDELPEEHHYRTLFETIPQGMIYQDSSGRIIRANLAAQQILGLTLDQLYNHGWRDRSSLLSICDEDGLPFSEERLPAQRILDGEILQDSTSIDIIIHRIDGQDHQVNVSGAPLRAHNGEIIGAVSILQDVTERRSKERETKNSLDVILAMSNAMAQETRDVTHPLAYDLEVSGVSHTTGPLENSAARQTIELPCHLLGCQHVGIVMLDPQTEVLLPLVVAAVTPEHELHWRNSLHGARLSSLLGDPDLLVRLHAGKEVSLDISYPLFRDQQSYKLIIPILKNRKLIGILLLGYGAIKPALTSYELATLQAIAELASLLIERERVQSAYGQSHTALQAANEELERMGRVKSDFLGIMSHEFRTALTGIQGFSEIMRDEELSSMEMKEFAIDIYADARRLVRMITDMLDLERIEARHIQLNLGLLELNGIIINVVGRMSSITSHHIRLELASVLPVLQGDREKLTKAISKLVQNAIKYSPVGSEVIVGSYSEGKLVHLYVRDYGVGIPVAEQERIFEYYAHNELNTTGNTLKLPVVREIARMHGGHAWVESIVGKGSIFHFTVRFTNSHQ